MAQTAFLKLHDCVSHINSRDDGEVYVLPDLDSRPKPFGWKQMGVHFLGEPSQMVVLWVCLKTQNRGNYPPK